MLDLEFLRSLGIKEDLLPSLSPGRAAAALPQAGKLNLPPELGGLADPALRRFLEEYCRQNGHYKFRSREGLVVAIYPHSAATAGRHDIGATIDQFLGLRRVAGVFGSLRFYRSHEEMDGE